MKSTAFFVVDSDGIVVTTGVIPESQVASQPVAAGHTLYRGQARAGMQRLVGGELVPYSRPIPYDEARRVQYAQPGDQLDAIWKLIEKMDPKDLPKETSAMLSQILAVKAANPK